MGIPGYEYFAWSDESVELMRGWAAEKKTATEIAALLAERFGIGPSRNAVCGKCHRAGIPLLGQPVSLNGGHPYKPPTKREPRPAKPKAMTRLNPTADAIRREVSLRVVDAEPIPIVEPPKPPTCEPVSLLELDNNTCRFPIGDPRQAGFGYCGAREADSAACRVYCPYHTALSLVPPSQRKAALGGIARVAARAGR